MSALRPFHLSSFRERMALPIHIPDLFTGTVVEWERLEFKEGWNPEAVLHTLCAFANDLHNWGGGYLVIGVAEQDGRPVLPPAGLRPGELDRIQKEILRISNRIMPPYHPVVEPYVLDGQHVLVLWAPGGQNRPYKAPVSAAKDEKRFAYYVRFTSSTVCAKDPLEKELLQLGQRAVRRSGPARRAALRSLAPPDPGAPAAGEERPLRSLGVHGLRPAL